MSSHHIVIDNQEPALLLMRPEEVSEHIIDSLLEWSPMVIASEEALPFILRKWIKIDALIVENLEINWKEILEYQWPVNLLSESEFPNSVIRFLKSKGIDILNYVGPFHEIQWQSYFQEVHLDVFSGHYRYHYINSGRFEKWMSPGRGIYLCTDSSDMHVRTQNILKLPNRKYEVEHEGIVSVEADGPLWVGEVVL